MTDKYAKLREAASHPGAQYLAELEASAKLAEQAKYDPQTWGVMVHVANASHARIAAVSEAFAAEKARADAAEAAVAELVKAISKKNDELFDAEAECSSLLAAARSTEATISTLTAERDALKRDLDEARAEWERLRTGYVDAVKLIGVERGERETIESKLAEAHEALVSIAKMSNTHVTAIAACQRIGDLARSALSDANAAEREGN